MFVKNIIRRFWVTVILSLNIEDNKMGKYKFRLCNDRVLADQKSGDFC